MATIKLQLVDGEQRIITKDGLISCECCEEIVCCPYSADQLGIGYIEQDLPNTITINDFVPTPRIALRTGTSFQTENFPNPIFPSVTTSVRLERATNSFGEIIWQLVTINNGIVFDPVSFQPCLFYVLPETPNNYNNTVWRDNFLDTYNVTTAFGSFPIFRQSLCSWSGFDPNYGPTGSSVTLLLNPATEGRPRNAIWTFAGFPRQDSGPYNSPLGTYSSSTYTWTITT